MPDQNQAAAWLIRLLPDQNQATAWSIRTPVCEKSRYKSYITFFQTKWWS
jgi:hypothetical protein